MIGTIAGSAAAMPDQGCYAIDRRNSDHATVRQTTGEFVQSMHLWIDQGPVSGFAAVMFVETLQPRDPVKGGIGGRSARQTFLCSPDACEADCPGAGGFAVTRIAGDTIEITTSHLLLGSWQGCSALVDLDDGGLPVTYRLSRVADADCEAP